MSEMLTAMEGTIKAMLLQELEKNQGKILQKIVEESMAKREGYSNKTIVETQLGYAVSEFVRKIIDQLLTERREEIETAVKAKLNEEFFTKFTERIATGIANNLTVEFRLNRD